MTRTPSFYSDSPDEAVYHNNDRCEDGQKIQSLHRVQGTDGRPLCRKCAALDRGGT